MESQRYGQKKLMQGAVVSWTGQTYNSGVAREVRLRGIPVKRSHLLQDSLEEDFHAG